MGDERQGLPSTRRDPETTIPPTWRRPFDATALALIQRELTDYHTAGDFARLAADRGVDVDAAWSLVCLVRRLTANPPIKATGMGPTTDGGKPESFWNVTPGMTADFNEILQQAGGQSRLSRQLSAYARRREVARFVNEDLEAAAFRDGLATDPDAGSGGRTGDVNGTDEIAERLARILATAHDLADLERHGPLDAAELVSIHAMLADACGDAPISSYASPPVAVEAQVGVWDARQTLSDIESCYRGGAWGTHPLLDLLMASEMFFVRVPFPMANALTEAVARQRACRMLGLPALAHVPLSRIRLDWERGLLPESEAPIPYGTAVIVNEYGVDCTPFLQQTLGFLRIGLQRLADAADAVERTDAEKMRRIRDDGRLNLRQAQLLEGLVSEPQTLVDVEMYRRRFDVATNTARADLVKLVKLGLLGTTYEGKRQVFWAAQAK